MDEDEMRLPNFHLGQDIITYLTNIRKVVFSQTQHRDVTIILGNPSCDLDSILCAFTLSYFYNARPNASKHHRNPIYVPVLNLPFIHTGDLWRLRPELGVAVRGAVDGLTPQSEDGPSTEVKAREQQRDKTLLENLITIHELANNEKTLPALKKAFAPSDHFTTTKSTDKVDVILVDHNAPSIESINEEDIENRFNMVGCIDHHVEEDYVPREAKPRIVRLGIGSCQSLVTQHLRNINLWTVDKDHENLPGFRQISRLALTPILIDTWDLKAPGDRVSDVDRDQVAFLDPQTGDDFDREDLFQQVQTAKSESLNLLHMQEIFNRDYKSYLERPQDGKQLFIGIGSVVQDLEWLSQHAGGKQNLINEIETFAKKGDKQLEIFGLLTRSGVRKEVAFFTFGEHGAQAIDVFEKNADVLQLQPWDEDRELSSLLDNKIGDKFWKVWWMGDTTRSRKQVAPLIRDALQGTSAANH
ncbi:Exopolyphosphatase [Lithohypha guttulata]|uniref:Exopolyphosphatase n=1 Tax=Lithohypha guttulata TaxID=1690604 RepID=UPI002DE0F2A2|nr:Exopolyphosphatase [Lithohypha guttulata]